MKQRTELWSTNDILKSIKERDKAFHDFKKHKTEETFSIFKELWNKTKNLILNAKRNYFKDKLESENKPSKSLWYFSRTWVCRLIPLFHTGYESRESPQIDFLLIRGGIREVSLSPIVMFYESDKMSLRIFGGIGSIRLESRKNSL